MIGEIIASDVRHAGALLTIDLNAVRSNYRLLCQKVGQDVRCGAVVKADAYGLGAQAVAPVLYAEGCRDFFVAHLDEGLSLRSLLPASASIYVLNGLLPGGEADCAAAKLVPVLNSLDQAHAWAAETKRVERSLDAVVQIDSGMNRLGLSPQEVADWAESMDRLAGIKIRFVMSHLACADTPAHDANVMQLASFTDLSQTFPGVARSFANSSGIFLGHDFHFDIVRPGAALYGINPLPTHVNPMRSVVRLSAQVIQTREVRDGEHVGYGWEFSVTKPSRLATVSIGYADGLHRALQGRGVVHFEGVALPVVGRVSMDSITVDVSAVAIERLASGAAIDIIGDHQPVDFLADAMRTSGYEVLTALGHRYNRRYLGALECSRAGLLEETLQ